MIILLIYRLYPIAVYPTNPSVNFVYEN